MRKCIEDSLKRLKTDQIDLWQLHRVDSRFPVEETLAPVAEAFVEEVRKNYNTNVFGLLNVTRAVLPLLRK